MSQSGLSYVAVEIYLEEVLGVGSYGKVCKAKCGQLPCAAKLLHDTMFQHCDPGTHNVFLEKFEQECQFLSSIKHPNIVQYLASVRVSQSNMPALLMELMDESLTKFLERSPVPLPYHTQLGNCHDIALALAYLHGNAIIHRDLSSNNVLVLGAGIRAKVTDFGMSKIIDTNPQLASIALTQCPGTLVYMPPEALTTPPQYSDKLDCFSHGVLTIQIITRNFPSPGDAHRRVEDTNQHLFCQIPEVERRIADISLIERDHTLLPIVLDCLKNSSSDRPSAEQLCERLSTLKGEQRYALSVEQAKIGAVGGVQQEKELAMKYLIQMQEIEQTKNKVIEGYQAKVQSLERELSKLDADNQAVKRELEASSAENQRLKQELEKRDHQITESEKGNLAKLSGLDLIACVAPDYEVQKDNIHPILERSRVKKGASWYIVATSWLKEWKEYVGYNKYEFDESLAGQEYAHPGPVDTSTLLKGHHGEELKETLLKNHNYSLIPAAAWELLVSWYGISEGSRPIPRKVVEYSHPLKEYRVEVYFLEFKLCTHSDPNHVITERFSRATTVGQLEAKMKELFSIPRELDCRLWHRKNAFRGTTIPYGLVTGDPSWIVQDAGLQDIENVILEIKNRDGTWPRK